MDSFSHQVWDLKYRLKHPDGTPIDRRSRTAGRAWRALRLKPNPRQAGVLDCRVLAALRITASCPRANLAGAGTGRAVTLFNCFVMGTYP